MIGGNITAILQMKDTTGRNEIGEAVEAWNPIGEVLGWLDYASGQADVQQYKAKLEDTTHFFICDFFRWMDATQEAKITSDNCRIVVKGNIYNILHIDNPMELNQHIEVFLQYVGGVQDVTG